MREFIFNYKAYNVFLRADGFSPVVNELGNLILLLMILLLSKWLGIIGFGLVVALGVAIYQKVEAYMIGRVYRKTKNVKLTKEFILFNYGWIKRA